eukprot:COSAG01_NODE_72031_length_254_cov_0.664516_1_plen_41_part_01
MSRHPALDKLGLAAVGQEGAEWSRLAHVSTPQCPTEITLPF